MLFGFFPSLMVFVGQVMEISIPQYPGLGLLEETGHGGKALISYRANDKGSVLERAQSIDRYLAQYRMKGSDGSEVNVAENRVACTAYTGPFSEDQVCDVPVDDFHPCVSANQYNYEEGEPCVFLKLDRIYNWKPQFYNTTKDLPTDMPQDLKNNIKYLGGKKEANAVWVSCEGENPDDKKNIGPLQYIPRRGFPSYYYPFTNKEGYLSPLVAVLFEHPRPDVLINIVCKAWAKNIANVGYERGSLRFALKVDRS